MRGSNIPLDVHSEPWSLWKGETEVESDGRWDSSESDQDAPAVVEVVRLSLTVTTSE